LITIRQDTIIAAVLEGLAYEAWAIYVCI